MRYTRIYTQYTHTLDAVLPSSQMRPVADARVVVEMEAAGARVLFGLPVDAGVEDVADRRVGVGVETVQAGAEVAGAQGGLCNGQGGPRVSYT